MRQLSINLALTALVVVPMAVAFDAPAWACWAVAWIVWLGLVVGDRLSAEVRG